MFPKRSVLPLVFAIYALLAFFTWYRGCGLPYVMDGNESWSNAGHVKNMVDYGWEGLKKSWGLADETPEFSGKRPDLHPVVYTHGGEFPRIWITLLYWIGFPDVASQILITALLIGSCALFFAYRVFRHLLGSDLAASLACFLMLTDYIGILQWLLNTWRVWQIFSFFGALYYVILLLKTERSSWAISIFGGFIGFSLFYAEPVFAVFTTLATMGFYLWQTGAIHPHRWLSLLRLRAFALGAGVAVVVLATQLIGYYGFSSMVRDAKYTLTARNAAATPQISDEKAEFYVSRNVMFMPNFEDGGRKRKIDESLKHLFGTALQHLPVLCIVLALGLPLLLFLQLSRVRDLLRKVLSNLVRTPQRAFWCLFLLWAVYINAFYRFEFGGMLANWRETGSFLREGGRGLLGLLVIAALFAAGSLRWLRTRTIPLALSLAVFLVLSLLLQAVRATEISSFWGLTFYGFLPKNFSYLMFVLMPVLGALFVGNKRPALDGLRPVIYFSILLAGVYLIVNLLVPGYVFSGYVSRALPLATFAFYPLLGAAIVFLVQPVPGAPWGRIGGALLAGGALFIWLWSAASFFRWMPPNGAEPFRVAAQLKGTGQGVVTPNYFMPFAYEAGTYALWCQESSDIQPNEPVLPAQFRREKWWFRKGPAEAGLKMPATFVSFQQRSNLLWWAEELPRLPQRNTKIPPAPKQDNYRKEKISWQPLPAIRFQGGSEEECYQVPAPALPGKLASWDATNRISNEKRMETIQDYLTFEAEPQGRETFDDGLRIFQQGSRLMVEAAPSRGLAPWKGAKVFLFETRHEVINRIPIYKYLKTQKINKPQSKMERIVAVASSAEGFPLRQIREDNSYRVGFQPLGADGRDGLVYMSDYFKVEDLEKSN